MESNIQGIIITNNELVEKEYNSWCKVDFIDCADCREVLRRTRDRIHTGARLLSHPMAGSMKPNQCPYRSVLLVEPGHRSEVDTESLQLIESSLAAADKFFSGKALPHWPDRILRDFRTVDLSIIASAVDRVRGYGSTV